ncbi:hypothetical protein [Streptomyces catenulae]|uniref:Uncharacterized protein n=1 Tax=Streptomyces catenulae TaxID=66875 RepID=A0ABV2YXK6_9ACTN|nr:hypothetical protein [Streptomyces catenulae]
MTEDNRPAIEQLLARLCGGVITGKDYVGYFLNEHGEELVFAQRRGEKTARFWHSDADWQMVRVGDHSVRVGSAMGGVITVGDLIIDRNEATWLSSCLAASRHLRQKSG